MHRDMSSLLGMVDAGRNGRMQTKIWTHKEVAASARCLSALVVVGVDIWLRLDKLINIRKVWK